MYSQKILALFKKDNIEVGDVIYIESGSIKEEGELMPKTESSDPDIIVMKLKNGYNIGVKGDEVGKVRLVSKGKKEMSFPKVSIKHDSRLPKVEIIYTGGTIGSKIDYKTGGVYMLTKPEELNYYIPELAQIADVHVTPLFSIASEDMTYKEWQKIAMAVSDALKGGARGVVITHGTDTMHFTASALSFMLKNLNAPVVITGSQRSTDRGSSDGFINLASAVRIAATSDIAEVGICMHAKSSDERCSFIRGTKARKMHTTRRDAFRAINNIPIATVQKDGTIAYLSNYRKISDSKLELRTKYESKVALIQAYPNSDPGIIDYYVGKGYRGIVIEGTGMGHVPTSVEHEGASWIPHVKNAVKKGVVVAVTSQCLHGRVNSNVYRNLRLLADAGAIYCEDMLPETAFTKLGWLLGNFDEGEARKQLPVSLVGEITQRTEYEENFD